jgi:hypothetical protein
LRAAPRTTLEEVVGCIPYEGPSVSVEEMDAAIDQAARRMWKKFERDHEGR